MKRAVVCFSALFLLAAGCTGASREVSSCRECNDNANWRADEYCVSANSGQLYCANPCLSHIDCVADHWCVPLWDEGTPWDPNCNCVRWVCMPESYYSNMKRVWYWGTESCVTGGGHECPSGMQCLVDDSANPDYYFCSDSCISNSDCVGGCCYQVNLGEAYCAPRVPYCAD